MVSPNLSTWWASCQIIVWRSFSTKIQDARTSRDQPRERSSSMKLIPVWTLSFPVLRHPRGQTQTTASRMIGPSKCFIWWYLSAISIHHTCRLSRTASLASCGSTRPGPSRECIWRSSNSSATISLGSTSMTPWLPHSRLQPDRNGKHSLMRRHSSKPSQSLPWTTGRIYSAKMTLTSSKLYIASGSKTWQGTWTPAIGAETGDARVALSRSILTSHTMTT